MHLPGDSVFHRKSKSSCIILSGMHSRRFEKKKVVCISHVLKERCEMISHTKTCSQVLCLSLKIDIDLISRSL